MVILIYEGNKNKKTKTKIERGQKCDAKSIIE